MLGRRDTELCWGYLKEEVHWKDLGVDERMILKLSLKKEGERRGLV
jgi:hypothetical protein